MASETPRTKTASICISDTKRGGHIFKIRNCSQICGHGDGSISSNTFTVGGYLWRIRYFPDGDGKGKDTGKDDVALFLDLMSEHVRVRLQYDFSLINQDTGKPSLIFSKEVFTAEGPSTWGTNPLKKSQHVQPHLRNDCLVIECGVTVIKQSQLRETAITSYFHVQVPPSNLSDDLAKLFTSGEGVDVTFKVKHEVFRAHKIILAVRSPVFKEELYGAIRDKRMDNIIIQGMEPNVFKGLLHFIYTDSLPALDSQNELEDEAMVKDLFVAADRYGMERMKLVCGSFLSRRFNIDNVTTTIALAYKHSCRELKDTCIKFIISSRRSFDDVLASPGYAELKRNYPQVALELWEKKADDGENAIKMENANQVYDAGLEDNIVEFNIGENVFRTENANQVYDAGLEGNIGEVSGKRDPQRENWSALPAFHHWLTSSLSLLCELACPPSTKI